MIVVRRLRVRVLTIVVQLILITLTVLIARSLVPILSFVPDITLGSSGTLSSYEELKTILETFILFRVVFYCLSWFINKKFSFSNLNSTLTEIYFILIATTLSVCYLFVFTIVTFSVKFFTIIYVLEPLFYVGTYLLMSGRERRRQGTLRQTSFVSELWNFVWNRWALVTAVVMLAPGLLALHYRTNLDFRNLVNYTRVSMNVRVASHWQLQDAYPGQYFDQPIDLRFDLRNSDQFYVLERPGRLYRVTTAPNWQRELVLDIRDEIGGTAVENGALSFAFHPEFGQAESANRGFIYVYYTHVRPGLQRNRLTRFDLTLDTVAQRVQSATRLIDQQRHPNGFHNGGTVLFGPDGFLYLSLGNFGERMIPQRIDHLAGGIIRIDVDQRGGDISQPIKRQPVQGLTANYSIPMTNPLYGHPEGLEEIWAKGLRNPFRVSFDPATGELWAGDVGDEWYEEINKVSRGSNGQSPYREGTEPTPFAKPDQVWGKALLPYYTYKQTSLERTVIGGVVYRGAKYPDLYGHYIFADNQAGLLRSLDVQTPSATAARLLAQTDQLAQYGITSVTATPMGDIYLTVLGSPSKPSGRLLKLVQTAVPAPRVASPDAPSDVPTYWAVSAKYDMLCSRCHGLDGKGEGLRTLERYPDFTQMAWQQRVSDTHIEMVVRKGGAAVGLNAQMPSWEGVLTSAELELMVQKIRSFGSENGRNP